MKRYLFLCAVASLAALLAVPAAWARNLPDYELIELPHPEDSVGTYKDYWHVFLNNRDEVAGSAQSRDPREPTFCGIVGFLFSPRHGMEVLDTGTQETWIDGLSDAGHVVGHVAPLCGDNSVYDDVFRYHRAGGFDFLEKGRTANVRRNFFFRDVNKKGEIVGGTTFSHRPNPFLYTDAEGWQDLRTRDPRINRDGKVRATAMEISDSGDVLLYVSEPGGYQEAYLLTGDEVFEIGHLGTPVTGLSFQRDGSLTGSSRLPGPNQNSGADHAVVYRPGEGLVDVHPSGRRFVHSYAYVMNKRGVVVGIVNRRQARERKTDVFIHRPGKPARIRLTEERIAELVPAAFEFESWYVTSFNRNLELTGRIHAHDPGLPVISDDVFVPFYQSPRYGLFALQELVDEIAPDLGVVTDVEGINDRGTMLITILKPTPPPEPFEEVLALLVRKR